MNAATPAQPVPSPQPRWEIVRLGELDPEPRDEVARLFVEAWAEDLQPFCKDLGRWARALAPAFSPSAIHVVVEDGVVLGIAACSHGTNRALRLDARAMRQHLGLLRGTFLSLVMAPIFHKKLEYPETTAYIEAVATAKAAQGRGVATALLTHLHGLPFSEFVLDVVDTNHRARRIYERFGYRELYRTKVFGKRGQQRVYMGLVQSR